MSLKHLIAIAFSTFTLAAGAAVQYGADLLQDGYPVKMVNDGKKDAKGLYLDVLEDTRLFMTNDLSTTTDAIIKKWGSLAARADYSELGYFMFSGTELTSSLLPLAFDASGELSVDLKAGDRLGFWVTDKHGDTLYSMNFANENGKNANIFNGREQYAFNDETKKYEKRVFLYSTGGNGNEVLPVLFGFEDSANKTNGQPLPGVLATLLLGSGVLGLAARRKRKSLKN